MDDKTKSIVAHLTLIGWIIALVMNQSDKGPNTSFYLRQLLGIFILSLLSWIPIHYYFSWLIYVVVIILWILSILGAVSGTQKPVPVVGEMFQKWFKSIS